MTSSGVTPEVGAEDGERLDLDPNLAAAVSVIRLGVRRGSSAWFAIDDVLGWLHESRVEAARLRGAVSRVEALAHGGDPSDGHRVNPEYRSVTSTAILAALSDSARGAVS